MKPSKKSLLSSKRSRRPEPTPAFVRAFLKRVQNFAHANDLWQKNSSFVIGVSGGPDSLCLLDVMNRLAQKSDWRLRVAHVNYGLRGKESDLDEKLVRERAAFYGWPVSVLRPRITQKSNLEEVLRDIRYRFFEKVRKQERARGIVVAHNKNDQAETLLMRLLRGSGLRGLSTIRPKSGWVLRPFLATSREDILEYLRVAGLPFRIDKSNADDRFLRNQIRHQLLPYLEKNFNPNILDTLARTAELFSTDYETLEREKATLTISKNKKYFEFSQEEAIDLSPALLRRELRKLLLPVLGGKHPPSGLLREIEKILKSSKSKTQNMRFQGLILRRIGDKVRLLKNAG